MLFGKKTEPLMSDDAFAKQAVVAAMQKMFSQNHFSICDVDKCLKVFNIKPPEAEYKPLNAIHCVNYSEMPAEFKQEVFIRTLRLFRHKALCLDKIDVVTMFPEPVKEGKKVYKRLIALDG